MYIKRKLSKSLHQALKSFNSILITGPRQSGKTTFVRNELSGYAGYISLDDPVERELALDDPNAFLDRFGRKPIIIDEIQYAPHLFSYIKIRIDEDRFKNKSDRRWIMTGSQQFQLMKNVSDSLAGRVAIFQLLPFDYQERILFKKRTLADELWLGGYPENIIKPNQRDNWMAGYITTYLERDVRQLHNVIKLNIFQQFMGLFAANHGQELNISKISSHCGISIPTCQEWFSVLNASYIIIQLPPYYKNLGKRIIKTPKIYFWDSALAAYLTRQPSKEALLAGSMSGPFFEGFVVTEIYKKIYNQGKRPHLYFWRSHDGTEVDLLLEKDGSITAIEIKLTATPSSGHAKSLLAFEKYVKKDVQKIKEKIIICNTDKEKILPGNVKAVNWKDFLKKGAFLLICFSFHLRFL